MEPSNFKLILWDFDGVIIESNSVREQGFREVLKQYPTEQVEELIDFHNANGGWSRYVKFRYFFEEIRKEPITDEKVNELAGQFSSIMKDLLVNPELLIAETVAFIEEMYNSGKEMHIVSGSDGNELRALCSALKIDQYFKSINGSPTPKNLLVEAVVELNQYPKENIVLIGDSINDYEAAIVNGISFIGFNNESLIQKGVYIKKFS